MKKLMLVLTLALAALQTRVEANNIDTVLVYKGSASNLAAGGGAIDKSPRGAYVIVDRGQQEAQIVYFYKLGPKKFYHDSGVFDVKPRNVEGANAKSFTMLEHQSVLMGVLAIDDMSAYFFGKQASVKLDDTGTKFALAPVLTGVFRNFRQDSIFSPPLYIQQNFTVTLNPALTVEVNQNNDSTIQAGNEIILNLKNKGFVAD